MGPSQGTVAGLASPGPSLPELQGPSACFAGACPKDGSAEGTHPIPALSCPSSEPPVPSWARWPRATLLSEWRREQEGLPAGWGAKKEVLTHGRGGVGVEGRLEEVGCGLTLDPEWEGRSRVPAS